MNYPPLIPEVLKAGKVIEDMKNVANDLGARIPEDEKKENYANYLKTNLSIDPDLAWSPNPTWWDIEQIWYNNPTPTAEAGIIYLITDSSPTLNLAMTSSYGWETSDGKRSSGPGACNITWDPAFDKPCYDEDGNFLYNTRWIIVYYRPDNSALNVISAANTPVDALYFVGFNIRTNSMSYSSRCQLLESYKFINSQFDGTGLNSCFYSLPKLRYAPSFPTPNCTNFTYMFANDYNLTVVGDFDQSKSINNSSQYASCTKLKKVPYTNSPLCINWASFVSSCNSLIEIQEEFAIPDGANISNFANGATSLIRLPNFIGKTNGIINSVFQNCYAARFGGRISDWSNITSANSICYGMRSMIDASEMDWLGITAITTPFTNSTGVINIKIKNLKVSITINHNSLSVESIMYMIRNSANTSPITLTIGSTNLVKLSVSQKAEATAKQITLA